MFSTVKQLRYLLLQVRNSDDAMRAQEVRCFARALACDAAAIETVDLLAGVPTPARLQGFDMVLLGGSGHYSVASGGAWLDRALDAMRELYELRKPTFA
jgi:GMP synthase (glutamine-hydrolysing)